MCIINWNDLLLWTTEYNTAANLHTECFFIYLRLAVWHRTAAAAARWACVCAGKAKTVRLIGTSATRVDTCSSRAARTGRRVFLPPPWRKKRSRSRLLLLREVKDEHTQTLKDATFIIIEIENPQNHFLSLFTHCHVPRVLFIPPHVPSPYAFVFWKLFQKNELWKMSMWIISFWSIWILKWELGVFFKQDLCSFRWQMTSIGVDTRVSKQWKNSHFWVKPFMLPRI